MDSFPYTICWGEVSLWGYWWTKPYFLWVPAFWSHHRQITPKSYVGPDDLGNTLQHTAQWFHLFSFCNEDHVLLCCQMDIWKVNFWSRNISWHCTTSVSHPVPPPSSNLPNLNQNSKKKKKKSSLEKYLLPRDLNTAYSFPNEPPFEKILTRAEEQNRW